MQFLGGTGTVPSAIGAAGGQSGVATGGKLDQWAQDIFTNATANQPGGGVQAGDVAPPTAAANFSGRTGTIDLSGPGGGTVVGGDGKGGGAGGGAANIEPGGFDVTASPLFDPIFGAAQDQFNIANESVLSSLPSGGALQEQIAENARRRSQTITGASADIAQNELANIMTLITGGTQQGMGGFGMGTSALSGLAGQQAAAQAAENAGKNSMMGGFGQGIGSLLGGK
jgi:hypothetical protein